MSKRKYNPVSAWLISILLLAMNTCFAQPGIEYIDSLISDKSMAEQIETLNKHGVKIRTTDLNLGKVISIRALDLAEKYGDEKLLARSVFNMGTIHYFGGSLDSAQVYYLRAIEYFRAVNDSTGWSDAFINLGVLSMSMSEYYKAIEYFEKAKAVKLLLNDTLSVIQCIQNTGVAHNYMGNYNQAYQYFREILAMKVISRMPEIRLNLLLNMGALMETQDRFADALIYYDFALILADSLKNNFHKAMILKNMGLVYMQTGENIKALEMLFQSLYIRDSMNFLQGKAATLNQIGKVYELEGNPQRANELYIQSLQISEEIGDKREVAGTLTYMGANLLDQKLYKNALGYFRTSLEIALNAGLHLESSENYKYIMLTYAAIGKTDSSLVYLDLYTEAKMELVLDFDETENIGLLPDTADTEKPNAGKSVDILNNNTRDLILTIWTISFTIISGLIIFIFVLFAVLISRRQYRKKLYRKITK